MTDTAPSIPRGRHAPPLEVRLERQRSRLFAAAAAVFARTGYAEASAESISREAGMSKATFYEHFANKEECILALFDEAAGQLGRAVTESTGINTEVGDAATAEERIRGGVRAFLSALEAYPDHARTLLVEIIGAGPRAAERRDAVLEAFAQRLDQQNAVAHERYGAKRFATPDDAFALVGAIVELASRQLRHGRPASIHELEPVIERVVRGVISEGVGTGT
jgi:AcrR family transcriptional regulator